LRDFSELKTLQRVEHFTRTNRSEITVARFFSCSKLTKTGKKLPKDHKHKLYRKIFQVVIKYTNIFHSKTLQNLPKLGCLV
jgi:hypothetical protein